MSLRFDKRPSILECEVDDILTRHLAADSGFLSKFLSEVARQTTGLTIGIASISIQRQAPHVGSSGTIDLRVTISDDTNSVAHLLIENKIDSGFTPDQPERYAASSAAIRRYGRSCYAVLCAPGGYIQRSKLIGPFCCHIAYESLVDWVDGFDKLQLQAAIAKFRMPFEPDSVPAVTEFFTGYGELAKSYMPELIIKKSPNSGDVRPADSRTIYFNTRKTLPKYSFLPTVRFSHQCWDKKAPSPSVKIMFTGWARHHGVIARAARDNLRGSPMYLRAAKGSLALTIDTPQLENTISVAAQTEAVLSGLRAASVLRAWMFVNGAVLQSWSDMIAAATTK